jgi:hypothetical protein
MDAQTSPPRATSSDAPGWPLLLALVAALLVLVVAGIPGRPRSAGDGSDALRQGWAEDRAREAGWVRGADGTLAPDDAVTEPSAPR